MAKRKLSCLSLFVICFAILFLVAVTIKLTEGYRGLTHALNIKALPWSAIISGHGGESWTDYLFLAEVLIDEDDVDKLLSGRPFKQAEWPRKTYDTSRIRNFVPMQVEREFVWRSSEDEFSAACRVYVDPEGTRVIVEYISD